VGTRFPAGESRAEFSDGLHPLESACHLRADGSFEAQLKYSSRSEKGCDTRWRVPVSFRPSTCAAAIDLLSLRGQRALVTGSGQGIGLTLARGLATAGAELVLNDMDSARLDAAVTLLRTEGFTVTGHCFNVANASEVEAAMSGVEPSAGAIDILINNAGIHRRAPLEAMPLEAWQAVLDVNLTSAFLVTKAVVPGMLRRGRGARAGPGAPHLSARHSLVPRRAVARRGKSGKS
jgi:hypothetical protein